MLREERLTLTGEERSHSVAPLLLTLLQADDLHSGLLLVVLSYPVHQAAGLQHSVSLVPEQSGALHIMITFYGKAKP